MIKDAEISKLEEEKVWINNKEQNDADSSEINNDREIQCKQCEFKSNCQNTEHPTSSHPSTSERIQGYPTKKIKQSTLE